MGPSLVLPRGVEPLFSDRDSGGLPLADGSEPLVPERGVEPPRLSAAGFEAAVSPNSSHPGELRFALPEFLERRAEASRFRNTADS